MSANKPYVIGLTGGIGSGKSTAADVIVSLGAYRVDADAISRSLTAPGGAALKAIRGEFGDGVFRPDGSCDRRALAGIVFRDESARRRLEGILHPMIRREMLRETEEAAREGCAVALYDVPLLFESGMDDMCDEVWAVTCPPDIRAERVTARDGLPKEKVMERIACQMSDEERARRADRVLPNLTTMDDFGALAARLYRETLERISGKGNA